MNHECAECLPPSYTPYGVLARLYAELDRLSGEGTPGRCGHEVDLACLNMLQRVIGIPETHVTLRSASLYEGLGECTCPVARLISGEEHRYDNDTCPVHHPDTQTIGSPSYDELVYQVQRLEQELASNDEEFAEIGRKLEAGTLHVLHCNDNHNLLVGRPDSICCCPLGKTIKRERARADSALAELAARDVRDRQRTQPSFRTTAGVIKCEHSTASASSGSDGSTSFACRECGVSWSTPPSSRL